MNEKTIETIQTIATFVWFALLATGIGAWVYTSSLDARARREQADALRAHANAQLQVAEAVREAGDRGQVASEVVASAIRGES